MVRPNTLLLLAALGALLPACGSDPTPPKTADGAATTTATAPAPAASAVVGKGDTTSPSSGSLQIEGRILKACGEVQVAHFAFDSAAITGDAATALKAIARCFDTGPLAGKSMKLVGHADPRGGPGYNLALGQDRANSVATFLGKNGLPEARVSTMSKGDMDATGVDPEGWALHRKVEMFLAE